MSQGVTGHCEIIAITFYNMDFDDDSKKLYKTSSKISMRHAKLAIHIPY